MKADATTTQPSNLLHHSHSSIPQHHNIGSNMHDDTPSGKATADRALAYWKDAGNFPQPAAQPVADSEQRMADWAARFRTRVSEDERAEESLQDTQRAWRKGYWFGQMMYNTHIRTTWY